MASWTHPMTGEPARVAGAQSMVSTYSLARRWNSASFDGVRGTALSVFPSADTFTMKIAGEGTVVAPGGAASRVEP
jgi:hypothetical protein